MVIKMASVRNVVSSGTEICRCGSLKRFASSSLWSTSGNVRPTRIPNRFTKIANYYEKPKEKKGPSLKAWATLFGVTSGMIGGSILYLGQPDKENLENDLYKNEPLVLGLIYRARDRLHEFKDGIPAGTHTQDYMETAVKLFSQVYTDQDFQSFAEPSSMQLLPDPLPEPYVQPPYTLVLEMTDVLVHPEYDRKSGWRFRKRPGIEKFLMQLAVPYFEIVLYTHENGFSSAPVIDGLDPEGYIMYRLYRDATKYLNGVHVKDLSCLNRDISKVILLDCNAQAAQLQPRNSLIVRKWEGDPRDTTLIDLIPFFQAIAASSVEDVREVLDFYRNEDDVVAAFKRNQEALRKQQEEQLATLQQRSGSRWSGIFGRRS